MLNRISLIKSQEERVYKLSVMQRQPLINCSTGCTPPNHIKQQNKVEWVVLFPVNNYLPYNFIQLESDVFHN